VDNVYKINVSEISRRLFFGYFPVWFLIFLIALLLPLQIEGPTVYVIVLVSSMVLTFVMYLIAIIPIVVFKPERSFTRRLAMILSLLIFAWLNYIAYDSIVNLYPSISTGPFSISEFKAISFLNNLTIGSYVCWIFYIEEKQYIAEIETIEERNKRTYNEKKLTEIHLRLLQAQIEPHFLFNTLTSILGLGKKDPQKAKKMQRNFMQYLKTTLNKTRASITTIAQEIDLIKAYLDIFKVRMGKRLLYSIGVDDEIKNIPFPSMLIQPIVENAIKHGLEPKIDGGEINIIIKAIEEDRIRWNIEDTGLGMSDKANKGTGLSNVKERLKSLYGDKGHLTLMDNKPSGVKVTLEVPYV
jgi:sensor histidine kinase YesM